MHHANLKKGENCVATESFSKIIFQNGATVAGVGEVLDVGRGSILTIKTYGTSDSRTLVFQAQVDDGAWYEPSSTCAWNTSVLESEVP